MLERLKVENTSMRLLAQTEHQGTYMKRFKTVNCCFRSAGTFFTIALMFLVIFGRTGYCAPVTIDTASKVARNLMGHLNATSEIASTEPVQYGGQKAGYLVNLSPRGYVLVAADDIRVPVKGYSLNSNFYDLPQIYIEKLLKELVLPDTQTRRALANQTDEINSPYWDFLLTPKRRLTTQAYTPDTFLLTTRWDQDYPYNKLNPKEGDDLTLAGCVMTAVAQIMRYHSHPETGTGVFSHSWNGQTLKAVMNRPINWDEMPDEVNGSVSEYQWDEVAALIRDLGILNEAIFGSDSTGANFHYGVNFDYAFERAFGYAPISKMYVTDEDFFTTLAGEIDAERPVLLRLTGDLLHMAVADGYASDGSGRKIHLNLGWEGAWDEFYFIDDTIDLDGGPSLDPDYMYYNIRPCVGGECDPFSPLGYGQLPEIETIDDMIIDGETTIRLDVFDPDGDAVALSASSSCDNLALSLDNNLLTLTPIGTNFFCRTLVQVESQEGAIPMEFDVLYLDEKIYMGNRFDMGGKFLFPTGRDEYKTYLEGNVTIRSSGGSKEGKFYIWIINDETEETVVAPIDEVFSVQLAPGFYTIFASLFKNFQEYYPYSTDYNSYIISVSDEGLTYTVSDHAATLGLNLEDCMLLVGKFNGGNGTVTSLPSGIDCGLDCQEAYACGTDITLTAIPDSFSMFDGWIGSCSGTSEITSVTVSGETFCIANFVEDYDQDDMPDDWEIDNGLDPTTDDAWEDKDGDGVPNIEEYLAGTDPDETRAMPWIQLLLLE
jgi:hypothetical protein